MLFPYFKLPRGGHEASPEVKTVAFNHNRYRVLIK